MASINGDLTRRVAVDAAQMEWSPSPSGSVWRKRLHLVGPPESGQVTSVVRYDVNSQFPAHDHPDGEEIFVFEGVFSDEHGDWPAGTYLLNPQGFRHTPRSERGCILFVKLRQYPGRGRRHVVVDTEALDWAPTETPGVARKLLYEQPGFNDVVVLERWAAKRKLGARAYPDGAELFVLEGAFSDEEGAFKMGTWLRLPPGTEHRPRSDEGCTLYVKRGGFEYLAAGD